MLSAKKNIIFFIFSFYLCGCSSSVVTKTLYVEGNFRYRAAETEMDYGYSVSSGLFSTDLEGKYLLLFDLVLINDDKTISISSSGNYSISARDDKNGEMTIDGEFIITVGYEYLVKTDDITINYVNYYFMQINIADIGKISFVR